MRRPLVVAVLGALVVLDVGAVIFGLTMWHHGQSGAEASADRPAKIMGQWSMTTKGDTVPSTVGEEPITLAGPWKPAVGLEGEAVRFFSKRTAYGVAEGTEPDNPGTSDFAMGVTFTSDPVLPDVGFSGNVMQKGRAADDGQVKISTLPTTIGGATFCRVEGTNGFRLLKSKVRIDDGQFHTAICWREGGTIGLTVDGVDTRLDFDPGSIVTDEPVRIANQASEGNWTDQHFGKNDCSVWVIGRGARQLAGTLTPC
jgi:hypothetical protein